MSEFEIRDMNNYVTVSGVIKNKPQYDHEMYGERFYSATITVRRQSGAVDELQMLVSERLLPKPVESFANMNICVVGQVRTYGKTWSDGKHRHIIALFPQYVFEEKNDEDKNLVILEGTICKKAERRVTPFGREIADFFLAVNRAYGKSSYIPCIAWGRNARWVSQLEVGQRLRIKGRFQSRTYMKREKAMTKWDPEEAKQGIEKTAYEVSIQYVTNIDT